jgi:hypothetical protein
MAELFSQFEDEAPQFGDLPQAQPEMETTREVRLERPQPQQMQQDVQRPRSIMERMQALGSWLVQPQEEAAGYTSSPLYSIGRVIGAAGAGMQGKGGEFLEREGLLQEKMRAGSTDRARLGLDALKEQRAQSKEDREAARENRKLKAYEQLGDLDFSPDELSSGKKLNSVVSSLLQAGEHTTAAGLIKLTQEAKSSKTKAEQLNTITNRLKLAKTKEEAEDVLLDMPADTAKEHHGWLSNVVKSRFGGDEKEKSYNTNDLAVFVSTKGKQRGPTIPKDMTVEQARSSLTEMRTMQQQQINVTAGQNQFRNAETLRDDYNALTKRYRESHVEYDKILNAATGKNALSDRALIVQAVKVRDPGSTVRETEAETVERARSRGDALANLASLVMKNAVLTPTQRKSIVDLATKDYQSERKLYGHTRENYSSIAEQNRLSKESLGAELPDLSKKKGGGEKPATTGTSGTPNRIRVDAQGNIIK